MKFKGEEKKMKEFKYRAWQPVQKEMIYFDNYKASNDVYIAKHLCLLLSNKHPDGKDLLNQYTGLKDKNGIEIYEGDILYIEHWKSSDIFDYSKPFVVEWINGEICFKQDDYRNFLGSLAGSKKFEVIGNIYENLEFLKEK